MMTEAMTGRSGNKDTRVMKSRLIRVAVAGFCLAATMGWSADTPLPAPVTEKPDAPFHQAVLNMALASGQKVTAYIQFRGGQGTVEHVLGEKGAVSPVTWDMGGPVNLWDVTGLRLAGTELSGTLRCSPTATGTNVIGLAVAATVAADGSVNEKIGETSAAGGHQGRSIEPSEYRGLGSGATRAREMIH